MKNLFLFFAFLIFPLFSNAQETSATMSNAERFCQSPGKIIKGQVLYNDSYHTTLFGSNIQGISLTKFVDETSKDSIYGVIFSGSRTFDFFHKGESGTIYKPYKVMLDFNEVAQIIAWIEHVNNEIKNDSPYSYYSYTPKQSTLLFYVNKKKDSSNWKIGIQFNKDDASSSSEYNISNLNDLYLKLKDLQKAKA